jgi:hypothetical protein
LNQITKVFHDRAGPPAVGALQFEDAVQTSANKHGFCSSFVSLWSSGFVPLAFAHFISHIALASEPAKSLNAGSLYRLGQRQKPATAICNAPPKSKKRWSRTILGALRILENLWNMKCFAIYMQKCFMGFGR